MILKFLYVWSVFFKRKNNDRSYASVDFDVYIKVKFLLSEILI